MTDKTKGRQTRRVLAFALVTVMAAVAFSPLAEAAHRNNYNHAVTEVAQAMRTTFEPDDESTDVFTPGTPVENCILDTDGAGAENLSDNVHDDCETGIVLGDLGNGNTFLDNYIYMPPPGGQTTAWPTMTLVRQATGSTDNYYHTSHSFFAWFGFWDDINGDDRLDDVCKWDTANAASDEFVWRGGATGENAGTWDAPIYNKLRMFSWVYPFNDTIDWFVPAVPVPAPQGGLPNFGELQDWPAPDITMNDRTSQDGGAGSTPDAASCPGNTAYMYENGGSEQTFDTMLYDSVMVTAVNPGSVPAENRQWALEDADYTDVDRYSSVNDDVGDLYLGLSDVVYVTNRDVVQPTVNLVVTTANDTANEGCGNAGFDDCDALTGFVVGTVCDAALGDPSCPVPLPSTDHGKVVHATTPVMPHEPNTDFDSYPGATYGGTSYTAGSGCGADTPTNPMGQCNSYSGYQAGWHAWIDVWPQSMSETARRPAICDAPGDVDPSLGQSCIPVGAGTANCTYVFTCAGSPYGQQPGTHGAYNDKVLGPSEYLIAGRSSSGDVTFGGFAFQQGTVGLWHDGTGDTWLGDIAATLASANSGSGNNLVFTVGNAQAPDNQYSDGEIQDPNDYRDNYGVGNEDGEFLSCGAGVSIVGSPTAVVSGDVDGDGVFGDTLPANALIILKDFNQPGNYARGNGGTTPYGGFEDFQAISTTGTLDLNCGGAEDSLIVTNGNFAFDIKVVSTYVLVVDDPTTATHETTEETVVDVDIFTVFGG